ncbi:MAG: hypothetical protein AAGH41_10100 [Pseudomonadota bacterium]
MLKHLIGGAAALALTTLGQAQAVNITLDLDLTRSSLNTDQRAEVQQIFEVSTAYWAASLLGYDNPASADVDPVTISMSIINIDGPGRIVGAAAPRDTFSFDENPSTVYTKSGTAVFDTADIARLLRRDRLLNVAVHEIAHVMGWGTLFRQNGLSNCTAGRGADATYSGAHAIAKYQEEFGRSDTPLLETSTRRSSTDCVHWDEDTFGYGDETDLMDGFTGADAALSDTSLYVFRDLGYKTLDSALDIDAFFARSTSEVPVPAAALLFVPAAAALARRRKRQR